MESNTSDFSLLPPHVIAQIFKLLKFRQRLNAARTCKAWYFGSCDPIIWKNTRVRLTVNRNLDRLDQLHRPFGTLLLQRIDFNRFTNFLEFIAKFGQYIRELEFDHCNLTQQQLFDCLFLTPNLKSFRIWATNEMFASEVHLTDEQSSVIKTNLNCVTSFTIGLDSSNAGGLRFMMQMMPNLRDIKFRSTDYCYTYVYKNLFDYINTFTDEVNFNCLAIGDLTGTISEEFFNDFSKITQIINVHELKMGSIYGDTFNDEYDDKFDVFCKKLSGVQILSMCSIGANQLYHVCRFMTQLTEICFTGMRNQKVQLIGSLQNLRKLTLRCSYNHTESEDYLLGMFTKLHQLKELRLDYAISERILNEICTTCTNLTVLELNRMRTNKLAILFKNLLKLNVLELPYFWGLQRDFTVDCDITNLKLLEDLVINGFAPGMTIEFIEKLPNLRPDSLLKIKNKLQTGYVDPELEDSYNVVSSLFD